MKKKGLAVSALALLIGAAVTASSVAAPRLWTDKTETTLLRSVKTAPANQPDALEFVNEGPVAFVYMSPGVTKTIVCNELEFGTTVLLNNEPVNGVLETKLALPFGVAEGDNCVTHSSTGAEIPVPTYFDTAANGAVPATISLTGPPFVGTIHKLKFSQNIEGRFCTVSAEGVTGAVSNVTEGFVEESPPNLNIAIKAVVPAVCPGVKGVKVEIIARFFLETMSTTTDTAFIGP
jgi:hypothetical protein